MFPCTQCDRSYASQNSLTRHTHSHQASTKHQCAVCGVIFYRRDLLSRHSKLHRMARNRVTQPSSLYAVGDLVASNERRRCHTACLRCRELRTKCDGQRPCLSCRRASEQCNFPRPLNRLSHIPIDAEDSVEVGSDQCSSTALRDHSSQPQLSLETSSNVFTEYNFENRDFMMDIEAWPWMHENLYLSANASSFPHVDSFDLPINGFDAGLALSTSNVLFEASAFTEGQATTPLELTVAKESSLQVVQDLISFATASNGLAESQKSWKDFWIDMSTRVTEVFGLSAVTTNSSSSILVHFANKYTEQFGPLWPLLSPRTMDYSTIHPQLFLVLTSIGAMYCGPGASSYGVMMHTSIRDSLIFPLELEDEDADLTWLAQARLLTQVAALYFGQPRAFTYAQHMGVLLVAQARKMDLFSARHAASAKKKFDSMKNAAPDEERLAVWLRMETRRRLAFGIFRGDTYTSVLLHSKPLTSLEEIDIQFPMCDRVWRGDILAPDICLRMIECDQTLGRELRASDIYRIALDRNEALPPLDPCAHELIMFGLQYPIWRFSRDQSMLERLIDCDDQQTGLIGGLDPSHKLPSRRLSQSTTEHETHRIDSTVRQMEDLQLELTRLMSALQKWEHALPLVKTFARSDLDRSSLMSGLILYHLGFLRLDAPLEDLHQIQYRLADERAVDHELTASVRTWTNSLRGRRAAQRSCDIWSMIEREAKRSSDRPVKFNLLAFIGLHHSAVVLWAYAWGHNTMAREVLQEEPPIKWGPNNITICSTEGSNILKSFVKLYDCISPGRWSSFAQAAEALAHQELPSIQQT